jgi:hypothetical protein
VTVGEPWTSAVSPSPGAGVVGDVVVGGTTDVTGGAGADVASVTTWASLGSSLACFESSPTGGAGSTIGGETEGGAGGVQPLTVTLPKAAGSTGGDVGARPRSKTTSVEHSGKARVDDDVPFGIDSRVAEATSTKCEPSCL